MLRDGVTVAEVVRSKRTGSKPYSSDRNLLVPWLPIALAPLISRSQVIDILTAITVSD